MRTNGSFRPHVQICTVCSSSLNRMLFRFHLIVFQSLPFLLPKISRLLSKSSLPFWALFKSPKKNLQTGLDRNPVVFSNFYLGMSKKVAFISTPTPQCAILAFIEHLVCQTTTLITEICFPFYLLKPPFRSLLHSFSGKTANILQICAL